MSFLAKLKALNSARAEAWLPLFIDDVRVGGLWRDNIPRLQDWGMMLTETADRVVWQAPADFSTRNAALAQLSQQMLDAGYIDGWRAELLPLKSDFHAPAQALIERAAIAVIGANSYGVHLNGLTERDGHLHMWLARRSLSKPIEPGKMDQIVAGGVPHGIDLFQNLQKEGLEEANIPAEWMTRARAVGLISYREQLENGIRNDTIFNYDLWLPPDFIPDNTDDEVSEFVCMPVEMVLEWVADSDDFKGNSAVVLIDFFVRHGLITPEDRDYEAICHALATKIN